MDGGAGSGPFESKFDSGGSPGASDDVTDGDDRSVMRLERVVIMRKHKNN